MEINSINIVKCDINEIIEIYYILLLILTIRCKINNHHDISLDDRDDK